MTDESGNRRNIDIDNLTIAGVNVKERGLQLWHGEIPLVQTFWLYYFVPLFVLQLFANGLGDVVGGLFGILALGWAGFMVMPIINAADKYPGDKVWALMAKIAAVIIGLGVLADLFG